MKLREYSYSWENNTNTNGSNTTISRVWFKYKLFSKFYRDYYSRTPESDSLYRRRNRLLILFASIFFYYKTSKGVFNRIEVDLFSLTHGRAAKLIVPVGKSLYFCVLLFSSQLFIKYIYYLNKVFKSYQFALEGLLKYYCLERDPKYYGDSSLTGCFDICDSENIKKNS